MGRPIVTSVTIIAGVANGLAQTQNGVAAVPLTLNGSLVVGGKYAADAPRRVVVHSNGNDSAITFTVVGTGRPQTPLSSAPALTETITGGSSADSVTTQDFSSVTSITPSGNTASTVTAGTNGTASGQWVPWDNYSVDFQVGVAGNILSGSPTWEVEYTQDDVQGFWLPPGIPFPRAITFNSLMAETMAADGHLDFPVRASRLTLTAYGGVQLTQTQQGI